ncbi:MAG: ATP-binding protein [Chitinophagaceae bacterium]
MKLSTQILLAFSIITLLSIADSYTNYLLSLKVEKNTQFLSESEAVIRNSNRIHKSIIEMQSAFRGYLLTDDTTFLAPYYNGINNVPVLINDQMNLIKKNKKQLSILESIHHLHLRWIDYADSLINSKKKLSASDGSGGAYARLFESKLRKQVGKKLNDEISERFIEFDKSEYLIRDTRGATLISSIDRTHTFSLIFLTLTLMVGIGSTIYIVNLISKRIASMVLLAENISTGEFSIVKDNRNDELTSLSRSLNIMSDKLSKNIHELEKRNIELDKFAYVVSHDLKAPVRGIHNVIKWIEEDLGKELTPELKRYLQIIPQRTQRMEDLINGLLEYARISQKTHASEVDVNALVKDILETIVPRHFKVEIDNLPHLYTERIKLEQVFTNLISNAVKYTPHSNGNIMIGCIEYPEYYQFSIKDNGIGIDAEYHEKIFEIFQTLREKNENESTGVGLAIVKKIIDEHHGIISLNSKSGEGAEFIFTWKKNNYNHYEKT